jgi:hypothetical protein
MARPAEIKQFQAGADNFIATCAVPDQYVTFSDLT